jgi:glycosyltransferase involved in cell wall biosynthesis
LYAGAYPDYVSPAEARFELGLTPTDFVYLIFGSIQRYKGVIDAITAFREVSERPLIDGRRKRLIIAGKAATPELRDGIVSATEHHPEVFFVDGTIPHDDVQLYFRAADVVICPYKRTLNSGAALLAMTFGRRVIAPALGAFPELITPQNGRLYQPDSPGALSAACESEYAERPTEQPEYEPDSHRLSPRSISMEFFRQLRARL